MHSVRLTRWLIYVASAVAIAVTIGMTSLHLWSAFADSRVPPPEFIAAAMKDQERAAMALEVRYSWKTTGTIGEKPPVDVETIFNAYYVRTPKAIFLKEEVAGKVDPTVDTSNVYVANYTRTGSYHRVTGQYRELREHHDGSPATGKVTHDVKRLLALMTPVESVVGYFASTSLYFLVEQGSVLEKQEIDGHDCWGVAYDVTPGIQRHVIWVDPDIGFCPRRIDLILQNQLRRSKTMRLYRELGYGVWFPKEVVQENFSETGKLESTRTIKVQDAKLVSIAEVKTEIVFPPGAVIEGDEELDGQAR